MPTLIEIEAALRDDDRIVDAIVHLFWLNKYPNNYHTEQGIVVKVFGVMPAPDGGILVNIGYKPEEIWTEAIEVRLGWNLCDGCKAPVSHCCCDEIAAEEAELWGPYCTTCGCDGRDGYGSCLFELYGYKPGQCPEITGTY